MATTTQAQPDPVSTTCIYEMTCELKKSYTVAIVNEILNPQNPVLSQQLNDRKSLILIDHNVFQCYRANFQAKAAQLNTVIRVLKSSEDTKSITKVEEICHWAVEQNLDRKSVLITIGGGVLTDMRTDLGKLM